MGNRIEGAEGMKMRMKKKKMTEWNDSGGGGRAAAIMLASWGIGPLMWG